MSQFRFIETMRNFEKLKRDEPLIMGQMAANFFFSSFQKQGWDGEKWMPREADMPRLIAEGKSRFFQKVNGKTVGRQILVKTGTLRKAVENSLELATFDKIQFSVKAVTPKGFNYGYPLNYGNDKLPPRKFIGYSEKLMKILREKLARDMQKLHVSGFSIE